MTFFLRVFGPACVVLAGVVAVCVGMLVAGIAGADPFLDAGPVVRFGGPIARFFVNASAAVMIGALTLACVALTPKRAEYTRAIELAAAAASVGVVSIGALIVFIFLEVSTVPFRFDEQFGQQLGQFVSTIELGQAWLLTLMCTALVSVCCVAFRDQRFVLLTLALALASLVPIAFQGHAAGSANHDAAVNAMGLHLVGATVWLGGLLTIMILFGPAVFRGSFRDLPGVAYLSAVLSRYSSLALLAWCVVVVSGLVNASLRLERIDQLFTTAYGTVLLAKVALLLLLGVFGALQRRWLIARCTDAALGRVFVWFVLAELTAMGLAFGLSSALAKTPPPLTQIPGSELPSPTPAQFLTGELLPPELTPLSFVTAWRFDVLWMLVTVFAVLWYLLGVRRLRLRGDRWPLHRTLLWCLGMLALFYVTNGPFNVYEKYLFSVHMLAHMVLTMAIPLLLVFGAPVTLASRAIVKRSDGSRGVREWILWAVHTPFAHAISNPVVSAVLFAGSLWIFYYTDLFRWATTEHLGHQWMIVHFMITGYLFAQSLVGIDPVKFRLAYPYRLILLMATMAFHAFFGLAILSGTGLMLANWFGAMGREWGDAPLVDQQNGGGIAWSVGEIPTVILAITVAVMWSRSDTKEAKRKDRNEDRTDDAELRAYNDMLTKMRDRPIRYTR